MQQRTLGRQGLTVSALGYGAMGINLAYGPGDEQEGVAAIQRAYDLGVTFFDTAELYGWGENERVVGRTVKGFRDDIVIATVNSFILQQHLPDAELIVYPDSGHGAHFQYPGRFARRVTDFLDVQPRDQDQGQRARLGALP